MKHTFTWLDYSLFFLMLTINSAMGIYYGLYRKQKTATDFLLGGKQMSVVPTALSIITSSLSGLILLSFPAEVYRYGATLLLLSPVHIPVLLTACYIYIAVFYKLQITSIYEYFKIRYDNRIRILASFLYLIHMFFIPPVVIYIPSLALSQVSGLHIYYVIPIVCGVCIFYTTMGGIKAAVWSDALQFTTMFGSVILVVTLGVIANGGFANIFENASLGGRLDISFDLSITKRDTFWTATIACFFAYLNHYGTNQGFVQKCLSLPSYKSIKWAILIVTIGVVITTGLSLFSGLVMFSHYFGCDPLKLNMIQKHDQLLPMYVMEVARSIPGLPGLFISGVFSSSMSALSSQLNCMAAITYKDFLSRYLSKDTSQETISLYLKGLVVIFGIICTALVYVVESLGSLLAITLRASAVSGGPLFGLFTAGMLIPMVHSKGAYYGGIISLIVTGWMVVGSQWYIYVGAIDHPALPVSISTCNETISTAINETLNVIMTATTEASMDEGEQPFILYRISFYYYTMIGAFIAITVSVVVSYFTERDKPLNRDCLAPITRYFIQDKSPPEYYSVNKAIELVKVED